MPRGSAIIEYKGTRGTVWRIKWTDAAGRQVQETLGRAGDGWSRKRAKAELRERLVRVEREGYRQIIESHLIPSLGSSSLSALDASRIELYVAAKRKAGLAPRTVNRQLNLLSLILRSAVRHGLVRANPIPLVDRPREPRRRWRILSPAEVRAVEGAFDELIDEAEEDEEQVWLRQARVVFLTLAGSGLRRGELLGLRWRAVRLADPDGPTLRVEETLVRGRLETPKSEAGERTIALGRRLSDELFEHRSRSAFTAEDDRVFCHPELGSPLDHKRYAASFQLALAKAKVEGAVRPFHDLRHGSITNAAAAGTPPTALMARAGHSDFKTTQGYIDLAGETFREEADRLERRLWGEMGTRNGYNPDASEQVAETRNPAVAGSS